MTKSILIAASFSAFAILSGCVEDTGTPSASAPNAADQACLRDVARETGNSKVKVLSSSYSEAGTQVIVGVGKQKARWSCIAYKDGTTDGIMSLTDEGYL